MPEDSLTPGGALAGIRVIDLATPLAEAAGRVLADLGAEVIKIEPPAGCASRFTAPFVDGQAGDPDGSLYWRSYGMGKRSVVLDIEQSADRERLRELVRGADILIESEVPGALADKGLDYETLHALNPSLLYVSVTPFGQAGPEATSPACDLTLSAAGGLLNLQGDGDRPPLPVGHPEASHHGAVQAAADAILALYARNRDGCGQHLDVSCQAALVWTLLFADGYPVLTGANQPGSGEERAEVRELLPGVVVPDRARCKDGFVVMTLVLGDVGARSFGSMMEWAKEHDALEADIAEHDWTQMIPLLMQGKLAPPDMQRGFDQFIAFLGTQTKAEVQQGATEGRWLLGPVWTTADLLGDPQLAARDYWVDVDATTHPGPFAKLSRTPIRYRRAAPKLGQDQELVTRGEERTPAVPARVSTEPRRQIFEGLKVADFAWVAALPLASKDLANLGATVIKIESEKFVDPLRMLPPWKDSVPDVSGSYCTANYNQSKLGLGLDLSSPEGREAALRIVDWADVVTESFTTGSAAKLGLDWESLRKRKPGLIMISSCMRGQTGPEAAYTGFGLQGAGLAGFVSMTGWPDRIPSGPWGAYTDFIAPRCSLAALGAALHHRDRTGEGQYIDFSQIEAAMQFIAPAVLDYTVNGRICERPGLDSQRACPHGVFATEGKERYVAIACENAAQWRALCGQIPGMKAFATPELEELSSRIARKVEIELPLAAACREREPFALAKSLRQAGVPAYVVMRATDLHEDPQLLARDFFVDLDHPHIGRARFCGAVTAFSGTPSAPTHAGPTIGQHSFDVLTQVLGYSDEEAAELAMSGALT